MDLGTQTTTVKPRLEIEFNNAYGHGEGEVWDGLSETIALSQFLQEIVTIPMSMRDVLPSHASVSLTLSRDEAIASWPFYSLKGNPYLKVVVFEILTDPDVSKTLRSLLELNPRHRIAVHLQYERRQQEWRRGNQVTKASQVKGRDIVLTVLHAYEVQPVLEETRDEVTGQSVMMLDIGGTYSLLQRLFRGNSSEMASSQFMQHLRQQPVYRRDIAGGRLVPQRFP